ncbi:hypothetical protein KC844_15635, partial [Proteus mirabilis]|uniref:hypothetical protein n=1 Tax=Proteus mirabilis TaxID=584 RepID=UPI0033162856
RRGGYIRKKMVKKKELIKEDRRKRMTGRIRIMLRVKNLMLIIVANHQLDDFYSPQNFCPKIGEKG